MQVIDEKVIERVGRMNVDVAQIAELLSVTKCTVRNWVRDNRFPTPHNIGRNHKKTWRLSDIMSWMSRQEPLLQFYEAKKARRQAA